MLCSVTNILKAAILNFISYSHNIFSVDLRVTSLHSHSETQDIQQSIITCFQDHCGRGRDIANGTLACKLSSRILFYLSNQVMTLLGWEVLSHHICGTRRTSMFVNSPNLMTTIVT